MAAPTTNNEVTARRLTQLLTGSDGNGGLWRKIKDSGVYYVEGINTFTAYSSSSTYTVWSSGAYTSSNSCVYSGRAYYCKTAITTAEAWNSSHWTLIPTVEWTGSIPGLTAYYAGLKIAYKVPNATGGNSSTTLNINGLGAKTVYRNTSNTTTHLPAGSIVFLAYDGTSFKWADYDSNSTYTGIVTAYLNNAGDAAKAATSTNFRLTTGVTILLTNNAANTKAAALTLNVNSTGAKTLYINGTVSSSSNYTIPAGTYFCHYDGTYWQLWTDGTAQFKSLKLTTKLTDDNISSASTWNAKQNALATQTAYSAKGTATKVPQITTNSLGQVTGITEVAISGVTPASHTHGEISNAGAVTTSAALASGDAIAFTDSSDSNKIKKSSITFDGSTATKALTQKGTWETFNNYTHPTTAGNKHVPSGGSSGQFLGWSADGTAAWVANPNTDTKVKATAKTDNVNYKILATASSSPTSGNATEAVYDTDITLNPSTNTIAANISGDAATASNAKSGSTLATTLAAKAPLASPALTGTPTAPTAAAGTNTTQIATTAFVKQAVTDGLATADAMIYKGTIAGGSTGAYGALTAAASKGWTYKVTTAGKIDGVAVEVGDMLICNADSTAAATADTYSTIAANWDFVQANLDGVVIGPSSVTSGRVATFDGTTGKLIKDSGYTIAKSVPSDAKFTDTTYTFDGTYSSSTNKAATVSTVTNAINALDVTVSGMGAGKTLTALTETDGKIAATFGDISITKSQVSDFPSSMTPTSHTHGNIANGGTLTDTAAAAAGNDYVVIRDADNAKIQTSTIKGTDVADAVSKKHSHSTLTLSTTAQQYDGSHTLALPSSDPYSSARTPTSHASSATTYGIGTTSNYGHVKLVTGDLKNATATDGCAASNAHTHSQYLTSHQTVDSAMSSTSTNPVQNKVVNTALAGKQATLPTSGTVTGTYYVNIAGNAETATHSSTYGYTKLWASGQYSSSKPYALLADKTLGTTGNWGTGWLFKIEMQGEYAIFKINLRGYSTSIQSGTDKVLLIESSNLSTSQLDKLIKATYVYTANATCTVRIYTDMSCCGTDWQRVSLRQIDNQGGDQNATNIWEPVNFYKNDNNTNMVASVTGTVMTNDYTCGRFWGTAATAGTSDLANNIVVPRYNDSTNYPNLNDFPSTYTATIREVGDNALNNIAGWGYAQTMQGQDGAYAGQALWGMTVPDVFYRHKKANTFQPWQAVNFTTWLTSTYNIDNVNRSSVAERNYIIGTTDRPNGTYPPNIPTTNLTLRCYGHSDRQVQELTSHGDGCVHIRRAVSTSGQSLVWSNWRPKPGTTVYFQGANASGVKYYKFCSITGLGNNCDASVEFSFNYKVVYNNNAQHNNYCKVVAGFRNTGSVADTLFLIARGARYDASAVDFLLVSTGAASADLYVVLKLQRWDCVTITYEASGMPKNSTSDSSYHVSWYQSASAVTTEPSGTKIYSSFDKAFATTTDQANILEAADGYAYPLVGSYNDNNTSGTNPTTVVGTNKLKIVSGTKLWYYHDSNNGYFISIGDPTGGSTDAEKKSRIGKLRLYNGANSYYGTLIPNENSTSNQVTTLPSLGGVLPSIQYGNELNFPSSDANVWINYRNANNGTASSQPIISDYYFCNRNGGYSNTLIHAGAYIVGGNKAKIEYDTSTEEIRFSFI